MFVTSGQEKRMNLRAARQGFEEDLLFGGQRGC